MLGPDRVSQRRACQVLGQCRSTQRRGPAVPDDEPRLVERMVELACEYGRYGYRRVTALLRAEGFEVNHKRVERLWRREGLKVPQKQPKRGRLWLNDGSCVRLRPERKDHVWSYDFVQARTRDGRAFRMLTVIDEFTRECLAIDVARGLTSRRRAGAALGPVRAAGRARAHPQRQRAGVHGEGGAGVAGPGRRDDAVHRAGEPVGERLHRELQRQAPDELLDGEIFDTLLEAKVLIERYRVRYNTVRPHSSLGYRPPAPEAIVPWTPALGASLLGPAAMAGAVGALT